MLKGSAHSIFVKPKLCTGCRACELVCSFHNEGLFGRRSSSIRVKKTERHGEMDIILNVKEGETVACDLCIGERIPLCVRFCASRALSVGVV